MRGIGRRKGGDKAAADETYHDVGVGGHPCRHPRCVPTKVGTGVEASGEAKASGGTRARVGFEVGLQPHFIF